MAELGFIGRSPGKYALFVGGNQSSTRLNRLYKETVKYDEIENELRPVFTRFKNERIGAERFGDYAERVLWKEIPPAAHK
jgi:sulfite reductase beta subunit-like hemoprotein